MSRTQMSVIVGAALVICISTAIAITALVRGETTRSIVEKSPCLIDPAGKSCQQIKVDSDRERTPRSACIITRKAGLGCPRLENRTGGGKPRPPKNPGDAQRAPQNGGSDASDPGIPNATPTPAPDLGAGGGNSGGSGGNTGGGGTPVPPGPPPEPPEPPTPSPSGQDDDLLNVPDLPVVPPDLVCVQVAGKRICT